MLKQSNLITVACCLLPVASFHKSVFNLVQDLSYMRKDQRVKKCIPDELLPVACCLLP
ncbi:MAG: hypothetical protein F6K31_25810 [Symploca sp. SIO2G7]|nr:hypothetical protein [Symploca sp. SIO2G7]